MMSIRSREIVGSNDHKITKRALRLELTTKHFMARFSSGIHDTGVEGLCIMGLSIWVAICHECAADCSLYLVATGY